ncbi:DUF5655 domain-containing protein, partial [Streptomyces sp. NPDC091215]|uniref:DUF5655 domain-containing protein n=1 Tax=Streptomyces sp. NPDC091215 TaxID=3155192 RepID=UPI00344983CD
PSARSPRRVREVANRRVKKTVRSLSGEREAPHYDELPESLRALYADLDDLLISSGDVQKEFQLHYIAYRKIKNVATVRFQLRSHALVLNLKVDPDTVELSDGFIRDVRGIGCLGTGPLEVRIRSQEDLARAASLVQRSVEGR